MNLKRAYEYELVGGFNLLTWPINQNTRHVVYEKLGVIYKYHLKQSKNYNFRIMPRVVSAHVNGQIFILSKNLDTGISTYYIHAGKDLWVRAEEDEVDERLTRNMNFIHDEILRKEGRVLA